MASHEARIQSKEKQILEKSQSKTRERTRQDKCKGRKRDTFVLKPHLPVLSPQVRGPWRSSVAVTWWLISSWKRVSDERNFSGGSSQVGALAGHATLMKPSLVSESVSAEVGATVPFWIFYTPWALRDQSIRSRPMSLWTREQETDLAIDAVSKVQFCAGLANEDPDLAPTDQNQTWAVRRSLCCTTPSPHPTSSVTRWAMRSMMLQQGDMRTFIKHYAFQRYPLIKPWISRQFCSLLLLVVVFFCYSQ